MFKHLRTKLTVLYAGLLAVALAAIAVAVYATISANAVRLGRDQLTASGVLFDRLLATRNEALQAEAEILAQDYGFRGAIATRDTATVRSALDNLSARLGLQMAFVVDPDGRVFAQDPALDGRLPADVVRAVRDSEDPLAGLLHAGGQTYQAVSAPIRMPATAGWVVFAKVLGPADMTPLEQLSTIPLQATVVSRHPAGGGWSALDAAHPLAPGAQLAALLSRAPGASRTERLDFHDGRGASLALVHPLQGLGEGHQVLVLRYPLAEAMKPFDGLFRGLVLISVLAVLLLMAGSWLIARTFTRPISALGATAGRLRAGERDARAVVSGRDEIAALGEAINAMADAISEREASLTEAKERAEAADRVKGEFLANMNHELRTPLNGVLGSASVLVSTGLDDGQRRMVELIQSSGEGLKRIVDGLLDLVELSAGEVRLADAPFDLGEVVAATADAAARAATAKSLSFTLEGAPDGVWVRGDGRRLAQVLESLLDNAVKFTERGGVTFALAHEGDAWRFVVRDTGVGFDAGQAEALFHAFRQADGSMTRRYGGVGVGLSLARDLARAMGGEVEAEGAIGRGACFTLSLPLVEAAAPAPAVPARDTSDAAGEDYPPVRILLAEDNPANRAVVELILGAAGVELVSVENGAEAVEAFSVQPFDVVLMDLQMPVMDGLTAIRLIRAREQGASTPIIVLSANVQAEHLEASAAAGADLHLAKPIVAATLLGALEQVLGGGEVAEAA